MGLSRQDDILNMVERFWVEVWIVLPFSLLIKSNHHVWTSSGMFLPRVFCCPHFMDSTFR